MEGCGIGQRQYERGQRHAIELTSARYVRLQIEKATQGGDTATRIYDFEVLGLK